MKRPVSPQGRLGEGDRPVSPQGRLGEGGQLLLLIM